MSKYGRPLASVVDVNVVYHCHILEHEDGGMMARIMVVPAAF
jgi:FtsP/CotA-like multicopper oxidase with cupredoxin domain